MMKVLAEAARDADEDVAFKILTQYAEGLTTFVELRYRLACLILEEGEGFGHDVTVAIANAFDDYQAGQQEAYVAPLPRRIPVYPPVAAAVALVNGMHFEEEVST